MDEKKAEEILTSEFVERCLKKIRESDYPMKPLTLDGGRRGYVLFQHREEMIDRVLWSPGWTLKALTGQAPGGLFVVWEPVRIEEIDKPTSDYFRAEWPDYM